jgi:Nitric oxide synthase, oxygenase domain
VRLSGRLLCGDSHTHFASHFTTIVSISDPQVKQERYADAVDFIKQCYSERDHEEMIDDRMEEVWHAIGQTGSYSHTSTELEYGGKLAWRNSTRCIGRHFWDSLRVNDYRDATTPTAVYEALIEHITERLMTGTLDRHSLSSHRRRQPSHKFGSGITNSFDTLATIREPTSSVIPTL